MSYSVKAIPPFDRQLKRLNKKYPSLKEEFLKLIENLEQNPELGIELGKNCYKIRIAISSKGKGKSGGARIITNIIIAEEIVYLLSIYDKSEKENISNKELDELLKHITE
jgi:mRNA-degrading endonuclease RelE of RelBE toxin-antitoxin system